MYSADISAVWQGISERIEQKTNTQQYSTWFRNVSVREVTPERIELVVPSRFHLDWIITYYRTVLESSVADYFGGPREVCLQVAPETLAVTRVPVRAPARTPETAAEPRPGETGTAAATPVGVGTALMDGLCFERFVGGSSNQLARAAGEALARSDVSEFSTLLVLGGVGLGKTHLLQAICREVQVRRPQKRVAYLRGEGFLNDFVEAIAQQSTRAFRDRYRNLDFVCFDDLQVLSGKQQSQAEFLHTLTAWSDRGAQVALAATCPQGALLDLDAVLLSRLSSALRISLQLPDPATRRAIVEQRAREWQEDIPESVVDLLCELPIASVRELEGALTGLIAGGRLLGTGLTLASARSLLQQDSLLQRPSSSPDRILRAVCQHFEVTVADLSSRRRPQALSFARQFAMFLLRGRTELSLSEIGDLLGGRDHTTVLHGVRKIQLDVQADPRTRDRLTRLETQLDS